MQELELEYKNLKVVIETLLYSSFENNQHSFQMTKILNNSELHAAKQLTKAIKEILAETLTKLEAMCTELVIKIEKDIFDTELCTTIKELSDFREYLTNEKYLIDMLIEEYNYYLFSKTGNLINALTGNNRK